MCNTRNILLLIGILFLGSCYSTKEISIEVVQPAKVQIDKNTYNLLLVNRNYPPKKIKESRNKFIYNGITRTDKASLDSLMGIESLKYLGEMINEIGYFNIINPDTIINLQTPDYMFDLALNNSTVLQLCKKYNCDGIICLESAFAKEDIIYDYYYGDVFKEMGLFYNINYALYDKNAKRINKRYIDTLVFNYNAYYEFREKNWEYEAHAGGMIEDNSSSYFTRWTGVAAAAFNAAFDFNRHIAPWFQEENRFYFVNMRKEMLEGDRFAKLDDWSHAAEQWKKLTDHKNEQLRGFAMFNLGLACEMEGEIDAAIYWVREAYKLVPIMDVKNYMKKLEKRKQVLKTIPR